eukprot:CAMPEP_0174717868 /NCGR_PEP_ID=MMETSP1094-20130205/27437_1 /TAXON_ID=156173 /ORGANISM="Chrysochromulina brevifilum, Strain UTEX LB 985" /LENGTH=73 /DNA_ID=CAMNT_0015917869 /DNA_START=245 /DNA_END=466 /DNA_ORIENTATION=+
MTPAPTCPQEGENSPFSSILNPQSHVHVLITITGSCNIHPAVDHSQQSKAQSEAVEASLALAPAAAPEAHAKR